MGPFETERLRLRAFREDDFDTVYRLIYCDPEVYGMYSSIGGDPEAVRARFLHAVYQPPNGDFGRLGVELKGSNILIGQVHLDPHVWPDPTLMFAKKRARAIVPGNIDVELAFAFGKAYWGKGYAYEACSRLIRYAFEELRLARLVGGAMAGNERSISLHKRLGYRIIRNPNPDDPVGWITILERDETQI